MTIGGTRRRQGRRTAIESVLKGDLHVHNLTILHTQTTPLGAAPGESLTAFCSATFTSTTSQSYTQTTPLGAAPGESLRAPPPRPQSHDPTYTTVPIVILGLDETIVEI